MSSKLKVYYLGAGDIAVPVLKSLIDSSQIELVGIGTQLDRAAGRKKQLTPTPLGIYCQENNIEVEKIPSVNDKSFIDSLNQKSPDMIVVLSFGQLLKEEILNLPQFGCINIHASLLPLYRGASPIAQAILDGRPETGVAFMKMAKGLDTGDVYSLYKMALDGSEYADSLELTLGELAAMHTERELLAIAGGKQPAPQDDSKATVVRKIKKNKGKISWDMNAVQIERMVRAYYPWPGAFFSIGEGKKQRKLSINQAKVHDDIKKLPGEVLQADKNALIIACGKGTLEILKLVPAGKTEMTSRAFLNGYKIEQANIN